MMTPSIREKKPSWIWYIQNISKTPKPRVAYRIHTIVKLSRLIIFSINKTYFPNKQAPISVVSPVGDMCLWNRDRKNHGHKEHTVVIRF